LTGDDTGATLLLYWNRQLTGDYIPLEEDLMKKIIALVLALSLMAAMVFAEPVVLAAEMIQTTDSLVAADLSDPLFADIEAPQLAAVEAEQVEGDGPATAVVFALGGGALGAFAGAAIGFAGNFSRGPSAAISGARSGAIAGAVVGAIACGAIGFISPSP
jgi:hypothetical protein